MRPVTNIAISATSSKMTATWNNLACVDHYIMKLRKVGPVHSSEYGIADISQQYIQIDTIIIDDDEDYNDDDDQGSGSNEYSTTRPKREMTQGYKDIETMETTTAGAC